ncbi:MAG: hypothetical protein J6Y02_14540 [Pseudobutyrivibrio sp.]|nr:hypothetical protein [Pseudobutyrivibrio sp.]
MVQLVLPIPLEFQSKWNEILTKPKFLYPIKIVSWIDETEHRKITVGELIKTDEESVTVKLTNQEFLRAAAGYLIEFDQAVLTGIQNSTPMPDFFDFIMHHREEYLEVHEYDALEILVRLRKI